MTAEGENVGNSQIAAREGITKVVLSRMAMAAPGMVSPVFPPANFPFFQLPISFSIVVFR